MADNLRERVAAKAAPAPEAKPETKPETPAASAATAPTASKPATREPETPEPARPVDPEPVPVHIAWARVMADVRAVGKDNFHNSPTAKFHFRGIDAVMNAVGPALRRHGVVVLPGRVEVERRDVTTSGGKAARECAVQVTYQVIGPYGDTMTFIAPGEALDSGDKATAKAMSVAYRTGLLQALCLPTDERDPDHDAYQRETVADPAERARTEFFAVCAELGIDPVAARKAFARRHGHPIASVSDAGVIAGFTAELGADPAGVLATPASQGEQVGGGKRAPARNGGPR